MQNPTLRERQLIPESCTMAVLEMLPLVNCVKPKDALLHMTRGTPAAEGTHNPLTVDIYSFSCSPSDIMLMDVQEFESPIYQRVYQYLRRYIVNQKLDQFSFTGSTEGTMDNCLQIILK